MRKLLTVAVLLLLSGLPAHAQFSRINSVTLRNNDNSLAAFYSSPFTAKLGADCTWSISGTIATLNCAGAGTTPGGAAGEIQYNNAGAFGGVTGLTNGLAANCDGFGTACFLRVITPTGLAPYAFLNTTTDGPAGNYGSFRTYNFGGIIFTSMDAWDGTSYSLLSVSTADGPSASPSMSAPIFKQNTGGVDIADSGIIRLGNNQQICWEANPTGTDICTYADTTNFFNLTFGNGLKTSGVDLRGATAGFIDYSQGTTSIAVANCGAVTTICEQAPTAVTSYLVNKPPVAAQGTLIGRNTAAVITQGFSGDAGHSATVVIGSGASIGSTSLCSTTNCPVGTYRVNAYLDITTACGVSGTYLVSLVYTDDQGSKTVPMNLSGTGAIPATGVVTTTSTANFGQVSQILRSTGAASINYSTTAVACGAGGPMVGNLYLSVEPIQ